MLWKLNFITNLVSNSVTEFEQKIENFFFAKTGTLDDQEWHLVLKMPTSRTTHAERERENIPTKQHKGKAWATKTQQDLPVDMDINSRLLACKV
jgi:hypothetical protein